MAPLPGTEGAAAFLRCCITNEKTESEITQSLGLRSSNNDPDQPVFMHSEVVNLYQEVKMVVDHFIGYNGNTKVEQLLDLENESTFIEAVSAIGARFGDRIWGPGEKAHLLSPRESSFYPKQLLWDLKSDRTLIQFLICCWIVKIASRRIGVEIPKTKQGQKDNGSAGTEKGKNKVDRTAIEISDGDVTRGEGRAGQSKATTPTTMRGKAAESSFRAPPAPMYPTSTAQPHANPGEQTPHSPRTHSRNVPTTRGDDHDELYADPQPKPASPSSASKRKSSDGPIELSRGKLPKVNHKWKRTIPENPKPRQRDPFTVPRSPPPPADVFSNPYPRFGERKHRENTQESDPTYIPSRDVSLETETEPDMDTIINEANALAERNAREADNMPPSERQNCSAGERHDSIHSPAWRDSVIPDAQDDVMPMHIDLTNDGPPGDSASGASPQAPPSAPATQEDIPLPAETMWNDRELRRELFKLLLSHLNGINQFHPESYDRSAEGRLNQLLHQFWMNDTAKIQGELSNDFSRLCAVFESWMELRARLHAFQNSTRYFGKPGEGWKAHLRGISDTAERAQACIALADLQDSAGGASSYVSGAFSGDLALIFDRLTMFQSCNGAEEFNGVERYNQSLLEWFV